MNISRSVLEGIWELMKSNCSIQENDHDLRHKQKPPTATTWEVLGLWHLSGILWLLALSGSDTWDLRPRGWKGLLIKNLWVKNWISGYHTYYLAPLARKIERPQQNLGLYIPLGKFNPVYKVRGRNGCYFTLYFEPCGTLININSNTNIYYIHKSIMVLILATISIGYMAPLNLVTMHYCVIILHMYIIFPLFALTLL